jgi:hypothetical protein
MRKLNWHLLKTLSIVWLTFLIAGLLLDLGFAAPQTTLLIDRSYCPSHQWQSVAAHYEQLYQQHQQHDIQINSVVLFSDLDQEERSHPPNPSEISTLSTYGRKNLTRRQELQQSYSNARILGC